MKIKATLEHARNLDRQDSLKRFRSQFLFPKLNGKRCIYLCGNSLGLQPVFTKQIIQNELDKWADFGVEGHFTEPNPWMGYHKTVTKGLAHVLGAKNEEVVAMGTLTSNIHHLLASFYKPTMNRFKILMEDGAFGSDIYAIESHVKYHGNDVDYSVIKIAPKENEYCLQTADILNIIEENKNEIAVVFLGGVNYYTGEVLDMKAITEFAHQYGIFVGFDLAHAVGNIELHLHDWQVDFATWCSYKYLNSGPGGISGVFIHENHFGAKLNILSGWWGHEEATRFQMPKVFKRAHGAEAWQQSNIPILSTAALRASLDIFLEADIANVRQKSVALTGFLLELLNLLPQEFFTILTPQVEDSRGAQLSLYFHEKGKETFDYLSENGVVADWRNPNVIRIAPAPLYNSFEDVFRFYEILKDFLNLSASNDIHSVK
ncbi:MAG: kynureninase [Cytophagales bacterium]